MPDAEIEAMSALTTAVDNLEPDVRGRVLRWAAERYGVALAKGPIKKPRPDTGDDDDQNGDEGDGGKAFDDFVDLFDAVNPTTDMDRALTAAYWFQQIVKQQSWQSQRLNTTLKDVGHGVGNITDALTQAQARKPALVRQMAKSGRSRQARKTYKLTTAGLRYIGGRLGAKHTETEDGDSEEE